MPDQPIDLNAGVLAPVADEVAIAELSVSGELPAELSGTLIRNGPNPFNGRFVGGDMLSWWVAPSMLHAVSIADGRAQYRNRWVRSGHWARHHDAATAPDAAWDQNTNVNVVAHAGRLLALGEGGLPFVIGAELETIGPTTFGGALGGGSGPGGMTAHPKLDPATGEMCMFRADWQEPYLRYGVFDVQGRHTTDQTIELPGPAMMHDFAITETRSIFLDLNVAYDFDLLQHGAAIPLRWHDDRTSRIGVMARSGGPVRWVEIEPCFIQHVINAYDVGPHTIVLDAVRYPSFLRFDAALGGYAPNPLGVAWRYRIELDHDRAVVGETQLDDRCTELPRIDDRLIGRQHRFVYAVEQPTDVEMRGLIKYDLDRATSERHRIPPGDQNSEPIFVPRSPRFDHDAQDDGWVLACVYRAATDRTDVVVLDARDIAGRPLATIHLPRRIPAGFHGMWLASDALPLQSPR